MTEISQKRLKPKDVSMFEKSVPKSGTPKGYTAVNIQFTAGEGEAIAANMHEHTSKWEAQHGGGEGFIMPVKVESGIMAIALTEYAADLLAQNDDDGSEESLTKATQAQAKAYALHNLPVYLFQLAGMFEAAGDVGKARDFLQRFLRAQQEFTPDGIDRLLLDHRGFDMVRTVSLAKTKLDGSLGDSVGGRYGVVPILEGKADAIATNLIAVSNDSMPNFCCEQLAALQVDPALGPVFECLCHALFLSVAEVVLHAKYVDDDAQVIMTVAFECYFGEDSDERLASSFQEVFNHAHNRYVSIWRLSVPLLDLSEDQMYNEWARTFASEFAKVHEKSCPTRKVEEWALAAIGAFRGGCCSL